MKIVDKIIRVAFIAIVAIAFFAGAFYAFTYREVIVGCSLHKQACEVALEKVSNSYNEVVDEIGSGKE
jgi:uncharacterized membrane protein